MRLGSLGVVALLVGVFAAPTSAAAEGDSWPPKGTLVVDAVVAIVGEQPITLYEFQRAAAPYVAKLRSESSGDDVATRRVKFQRVRDDVIESLISDHLIVEEAQKMDIKVSKEDVDVQVNQVKKSNDWTDEEFAEAVTRLGFATLTDYRRHVRRELLKNRVIGIKVSSKIRLDPAEAKRVFREQYGDSGTVEERRVAHILVRLAELAPETEVEETRERLVKLREAIAAGEDSFEEMARKHSQDTTARSGGDVGWISRGDTDPDFEKVAFLLAHDVVSEPVRTGFGLHLIKVTAVRKRRSIDVEKKAALMRQIRYRLRERELKRHYKQWVDALRKDAFVEIKTILKQALSVQ